MKTNYQIKRELDGKVEVIHTETNKRKIESFFNSLKRNFKKGGIWVREIRIGYFQLPNLEAEYYICKA